MTPISKEKESLSTQNQLLSSEIFLFYLFFVGLECVGHSFAYVAHFVFLRNVWIRTHKYKKIQIWRQQNAQSYVQYTVDYRSYQTSYL